MGEKLIVGPVGKGLNTTLKPFNIDNDSFAVLRNAYQYRGRVLRKRGTTALTRLNRFVDTLNASYGSTTTISLNGTGVGNLKTGFSLEATSNIRPGTVTITAPGPNVYTDTAQDGTLSPSGSINYASGVITILAEAGNAISASFNYYPSLPVMGSTEVVDLDPDLNISYMSFDTKYSYQNLNTFPYNSYNVTFFKNPVVSTTMPGYVPKSTVSPFNWNGQDYQLFWTLNYEGAFWATNGITIPFNRTNIGMQYRTVGSIASITAGPPASATFTIANHGLEIGDFLFFNEFNDTIITGLNFQTGYVTAVPTASTVTVTFPNATLGGPGGVTVNGIAQYLTKNADPTKDCIRFYDGDPTNGNALNPTLNGNHGWVNFCPPLSQFDYVINERQADQYYLAGARMIVSFKDRLLFIGPVIQTSTAGSQIYLQDTVIYSENGTPYYTASFTGAPELANTVFYPLLVPQIPTTTPTNYSARPSSFWGDQTGFGGWQAASLNQRINSVGSNEDVLVMGLDDLHTRFVYSGNDITPFAFYVINSELGASSPFSALSLDKGVMVRGDRGFVISSQVETKRFDDEILDEVFTAKLTQNGSERIISQRDFINEWIYFTYPSNSFKTRFPSQTLLYNYRDNSWGQLNETYTAYGSFKKRTGLTWGTIGTVYPTWSVWNVPWNSGKSTLLQPMVTGGNQHGFIMIRDDSTDEDPSLYIQNILGSSVVSPDHCLNQGDYIIIKNALGTVGSSVNDKIFQIQVIDENTFNIYPTITPGTYLGNGTIIRMYIPFMQTKQFPMAWGMSRKTRIGPQQYLLTKTDKSKITLNMYLSQNGDQPYNDGPIVPDPNSKNNSLIYSTVLYTCPESTNLGLTPFASNLNTPTANSQAQIWHRKNTSLIGDTVQLAFTMDDEQMREVDENGKPVNAFAEIELHGFIADINPSQLLT